MSEQQLQISVPHYYLTLPSATTNVDPLSCGEGVTASLLKYDANLFTAQSRGRRDTQAYSGLNAGLNLGGARVRHNASVTWSPSLGGRYQRVYSNGI